MGKKGASRCRFYVGASIAAWVLQIVPDLEVLDFASPDAAFAAPKSAKEPLIVVATDAVGKTFVTGHSPREFVGHQAGMSRIRRAVGIAPLTGIGQRVINAMGAGAVASVIQAVMAAVFEPVVNRVLVQRVKVRQAFATVKPAMVLAFFKTTLFTNFLKFPLFEAINAFCGVLALSPSVRGLITGLVFTSFTLPVTNYRYHKSMQQEVKWDRLYDAYFPSVLRDVVYGVCRNYLTLWTLSFNSAWEATSPEVLFIVVILACVGCAPFNEWRGFLLQPKGQEKTFTEFFRPSSFLRSTSIGSLTQGVALAAGYWCSPPTARFVKQLIAAYRR